MSLRRTALARKTELRRTAFKQAVKADIARRKTARKNRDTGPTAAERAVVAARAGWCCELCGVGVLTGASSVHHRQNRGMGGSSRPERNAAYNLLLVCGTGTTGCHGFIGTHPKAAEQEGWLVRHPTDPATVPVSLHRGRVLLTVDGDYVDVAA